jgi:hypothetical protein
MHCTHHALYSQPIQYELGQHQLQLQQLDKLSRSSAGIGGAGGARGAIGAIGGGAEKKPAGA